MSSDHFLFPRLDDIFAKERFKDISDLSISDLAETVSFNHPRAEFAPTGGNQVSKDRLVEIRSAVVELASELGFPGSRTRAEAAVFDAKCGGLLHETIPIFPAEAARKEVWSFLTLMVIPDVARWRFPDAKIERFVGGVRNTFQRLWWRGQALRDEAANDKYHLLMELDEDVLVGIMERPGISSNSRLACAIGKAAVNVVYQVEKSKLEDTRRDALKRVRQRIPVVCLEALDDPKLRAEIKGIFERAAESIS